MLNQSKKVKILLYGNIYRHYRSSILIEFLLKSKYHIFLASPDLFIKDGSKNFVEKFLTIFSFIELLIKAAFVDVIYLLPLNTVLINSAVWVAKLWRKKLVVEMYISIYDTFVRDRKTIKDGSRKAKSLSKKDKLVLTQADYVIIPANYELNYWEKLLSAKFDQSKVLVAPLCNVSSSILKKTCKQDGVLKICWWGTFIPLHGIDNILQAMKILQKRGLLFSCNLFGVDNPCSLSYTDKIKQEKLDNCVYLRKDLNFANGSLPQYLVENCDLALGIFGNTDKARNAVPNKLVEALSLGIPTLTMNSTALQEFFNPATDFWTCDPSPEAIAESILLIASGTAYPVDWLQTRQKVLDTFSVVKYQKVVNQVLQKIIDNAVEIDTVKNQSQLFSSLPTVFNQTDH